MPRRRSDGRPEPESWSSLSLSIASPIIIGFAETSVLSAAAVVGRRFWVLFKPSDIASAEISITKRRIVEVIACFVLAAVAAHGVLS